MVVRRINPLVGAVTVLLGACLVVAGYGIVHRDSRVSGLAIGTARIEASLWTPWVAVSDFAASEPVTLTVDLDNDGNVDWSATQTTSTEGASLFNLGTVNVRVGARIAASSSTYLREMIVVDVRIEYANSATNVVSGVAPAGSQVRVQVQQAGPPLADVTVSADAEGRWSYDFTGTYDIESGRSLTAQVSSLEGNVTRVSWKAVIPTVAASYSQYGANSVVVKNFAPGTSVRLRIDYENDGGPIDGYDYDETRVVDNPFGFGFNIGGFDLIRPGDEFVATGGGWAKTLSTTLLRIEKADPSTDVVGGVARSSDLVTVGVMSESGWGPPVAQQTVTADPSTGDWAADFAALADFDAGRQVTASVFDVDGDETSTTWTARTPRFTALVTDGPPSSVRVTDFARGTTLRLRVDLDNDGGYDIDRTEEASQMFGHSFDLGGSGLLNAGDRILVTGGGWVKEGVLVALSVSSVDPMADSVRGTAVPGARVDVAVSVPPGEPGGPPIAVKSVTADGDGNWVAIFLGEVDIVPEQQVNATISDEDGDATEAIGWASRETWPVTGFEKPIVNPPGYTSVKAGSVVPVKFSLGGDRGLDVFESGFPASGVIPCGSNPNLEDGTPIVSPGKTPFRYEPAKDIYELRWSTSKLWSGTCRQLIVKLVDGSVLRANFRFGR